MLLSTTDLKREYETLGLVRGSEMKPFILAKM